MSGTFATFNTANSALSYAQVALQVSSTNIANASTPGFTRRQVQSASAGSPSTPALWSRYDGQGDGVQVTGVSRMTDALLDARVRTEHGRQSYLDVRQSGLEDLQSSVDEPSTNGVGAALSAFRSAWHDVANAPGPSSSARTQLLAQAQNLASALNTQSTNVTATTATQAQKLMGDVNEVNSVAASLADTNNAIATGSLAGADVSNLLDTRDTLTLRLSQLTGGTATIRADGGADVSVGGVPLVQGAQASTLAVASGVSAAGVPDGSQVTFTLTPPGGSPAALAGISGGEVGGLTQMLNVTLPAYKQGLDNVAKQLADTVNTQHEAGYDANGNAGTAMFAYDPSNPAASLTVAITDPALIAASSVPGGGLDSGNADALATTGGVDSSYQQLVSGLGTSVQSAETASASQQVLTDQFDSSKEQISGVNLDEETVNMMQDQRSYEAAAKVVSTLDSMLDTLINRMLI